jgi:hypothetical protein
MLNFAQNDNLDQKKWEGPPKVAKTCFDTNIHPYYKIKIPMKT